MAKRIVKLPPGEAPVFGEPLPTVAAPPKENLRTRGEEIGVACGLIAGIPRQCEAIAAGIADIRKRCALAMTARDVLKREEDAALSAIGQECFAVEKTVRGFWREVDAMIAAGIGLPEKKPAEETEW